MYDTVEKITWCHFQLISYELFLMQLGIIDFDPIAISIYDVCLSLGYGHVYIFLKVEFNRSKKIFFVKLVIYNILLYVEYLFIFSRN